LTTCQFKEEITYQIVVIASPEIEMTSSTKDLEESTDYACKPETKYQIPHVVVEVGYLIQFSVAAWQLRLRLLPKNNDEQATENAYQTRNRVVVADAV
jgi:hypothetical protein